MKRQSAESCDFRTSQEVRGSVGKTLLILEFIIMILYPVSEMQVTGGGLSMRAHFREKQESSNACSIHPISLK
jgi:hypothetical protein